MIITMVDSSSATFYNDILSSAGVGSSCGIVCGSDVFHIIKTNWGAVEDFERNSSGVVEQCWIVQGDDLIRLRKICNNAKTPNQVVKYLYSRFVVYQRMAHYELLQWIDKKGILYSFSEY